MYNILIILPISIAGELILNSFAKGLRLFGSKVSVVDVRELEGFCVDFVPDVVISYDYGYLIFEESKNVVKNLLSKNPNIRLLHYFADDPHSKYALSGNKDLPDVMRGFSRNIELIFWDKKYLKTFDGLKSSYFPICVDCEIYKNYNLPKKYDITFVGRPLGDNRPHLIASVIKNFGSKLKIFSHKKHFENSVEDMRKFLNDSELKTYLSSYCGFIESPYELSKIYNSSKINLNINLQGENSHNLRTFEVLASKAFLLNDREFLKNEFCACFDNENDLIQKISFYLENEAAREEIAARAGVLVREKYNILKRACEILNIVE